MFTRAITRKPGADFGDGLTTSELGAPSLPRMLEQHGAYVALLRELGLAVDVLETLQGHPDAYFVEDVAVVTPEVAVITRPGAPARRGEEESMVKVLALHRPVARLEAPATLDGGDVLMVGRHFFIGVSQRTNAEGARALGAILARLGCTWTPVPVGDGLHLKSSVNWVGGDTLLLSEAFRDRPEFRSYRRLVVAPEEAYAGNTLWVNGHLIVPSGFPRTLALVEGLGLPVHLIDTSEARKMDGGLTCMSLRF
jgi:dimethylargininase